MASTSTAGRASGARWGARSAVAAGFALLTAALVGAPLYVSSAGSEAVQLALASSCATDTSLRLTVVPDPATGPVDRAELTARTAAIPLVEIPVLVESAAVPIAVVDPASGGGQDAAVVRRGRIVSRQGWPAELGLDDLTSGVVVTQESTAAIVGLRAGDHLQLGTGSSTGDRLDVLLDRTVPDVPILPEPSFWCGLREALRPSGFGDPPPPLLLAASATLAELEAATDVRVERVWEVRPGPVRTLRDARRVRDAFRAAISEHDDEIARRLDTATGSTGSGRRVDASVEGMTTVVNRGEALSVTVGRAVAPVRLAGVLAATSVLLAAATMLARERHRELRLLALRGIPPHRTAVRLWTATAPPAVVGTIVGSGLALLAVRTLGPTPELETPVVARSIAIAVAAAGLATLLVAVTAAVVGDRFVDRSIHGRRWRYVPWEVPALVVGVVSYRRLRDGGGLRFTGVESRGGELLAQAFPLVALGVLATVMARPMQWCLGRLRRTGTRLPLPVRLGWRRATAEPALATVLVASITLAVGAVVLSGILSASASAELRDKAAVFVGSDLAVALTDPAVVPDGLRDQATVVARADARLADPDSLGTLDDVTASASIDVLGIDPTNFAAVARATASTDLRAALDAVAGPTTDGAIAAVVVRGGALADVPRFQLSSRNVTFDVRPVATASVFPGLRSGTTLVVVDAAALRSTGLDVTDVVWVRDPPADAVQQLVDAGNRTRTVVSPADVFDVVSFRAQRWTYDVLAAFGVLVGVVVLVLQLLVSESRAGRRRLSQVVLGRVGATARDRWLSAVVEHGTPLVVGGVIGAGAARVVAGRVIHLLDPLPTLAPGGRVVVPGTAVLAAAAVVVVTIVVLAVVSAVADTSGDTMEVVRGTA